VAGASWRSGRCLLESSPPDSGIAARDAQLVTLRGHSALDRLGGDVQAKWDSMSADDRRSIIQSLVARIEVAKAPTLAAVVVAYRDNITLTAF
jgi:hypothetical protein